MREFQQAVKNAIRQKRRVDDLRSEVLRLQFEMLDWVGDHDRQDGRDNMATHHWLMAIKELADESAKLDVAENEVIMAARADSDFDDKHISALCILGKGVLADA